MDKTRTNNKNCVLLYVKLNTYEHKTNLTWHAACPTEVQLGTEKEQMHTMLGYLFTTEL